MLARVLVFTSAIGRASVAFAGPMPATSSPTEPTARRTVALELHGHLGDLDGDDYRQSVMNAAVDGFRSVGYEDVTTTDCDLEGRCMLLDVRWRADDSLYEITPQSGNPLFAFRDCERHDVPATELLDVVTAACACAGEHFDEAIERELAKRAPKPEATRPASADLPPPPPPQEQRGIGGMGIGGAFLLLGGLGFTGGGIALLVLGDKRTYDPDYRGGEILHRDKIGHTLLWPGLAVAATGVALLVVDVRRHRKARARNDHGASLLPWGAGLHFSTHF